MEETTEALNPPRRLKNGFWEPSTPIAKTIEEVIRWFLGAQNSVGAKGLVANHFLPTCSSWQGRERAVPPSGMLYLKDAVLEGGVPFQKAPAYKYAGIDSNFNEIFNNAIFKLEQSRPTPIQSKFKHTVSHNCNHEECVRLLENCYKALLETGKVIIIDILMPEGAETNFKGKLAAGGRERTGRELAALSEAAGFSCLKVISCFRAHSIVELHQ
ncbi:O-methyltransferase domain [Dillenia turbinata]|uniref:O-methyltransferase domain n=1 Tax=Dillenia turbinata TaxID=194707 RepID=A0AAN8ZKK4_9MAGN